MTMTILQHMFAANNVFRSQSMSVIANFLPGRISSKCASFNSVSPLVQRTSSLLGIRSFCSNQTEEQFPKSSTSQEAWKEKVTAVSMRLQDFHYASHVYIIDCLRGKRKLQSSSMEKEMLSYRKRWALNRLINKIEDTGRRLIDENVDEKCQVFYLADQLEKWILHGVKMDKFEILHYDQCWLSLLKSSENPLAYKLREKLSEASITPVTFSKSVSKVYIELQDNLLINNLWSIEVVDFGVDDIKEVLNDLSINDTEYKCIKILFNLEESEKWQIKNYEKVQHPAVC